MNTKVNPWRYVPLLFVLQALPVTIVQELSQATYKDLGVPDAEIARWSALISLPWALQMIFGPFVDLNSTKRKWVLTMQMLIAVGLIAAAWSLKLPNFFPVSLAILGLTGIFSAFCNVAIDGFTILSMDEEERGKTAAMMSTFYKVGRMFIMWGLLTVAGRMLVLPELKISPTESLLIENGLLKVRTPAGLTDPNGRPVPVPSAVNRMWITENGEVWVANNVQTVALTSQKGTFEPAMVKSPMTPDRAWLWVWLVGAAAFLLMYLANLRAMPKPEADRPKAGGGGETISNGFRLLALLSYGLGGYFLINSIVRLTAQALWANLDGKADGPLRGWMLPADNTVLGFSTGLPPVTVEWIQFGVCLGVLAMAWVFSRRTFPGSEMATTVTTFVRQPNIGRIFFFLVFYRFAELLIARTTTLFLKSSLADGGMAVSNDQLAAYGGAAGLVGITLGGIVGGWFVQSWGLKKSFIPLALSMHLPNALYLLASLGHFPRGGIVHLGALTFDPALFGLLFVDQFGYGFGFTGFMVYTMWVAQRGQYQTSHYAFMTGFNALVSACAGVFSAVLLKAGSFPLVFWVVLAAAVPSLISLGIIPLDDSHRKIKVDVD